MKDELVRMLAIELLIFAFVLMVLVLISQFRHDDPVLLPGIAESRATSERLQWELDFQRIRDEIAATPLPERLGHDHPDWRFDTAEWNRAYLDYFGQPDEATAAAQGGAR